VGIAEDDPIAKGVSLYPNPAHDRITLSSANATIRYYAVYDVNGRRVRAGNVERGSVVLSRGDLQAGVYYVTLEFDEGTVTRKLVLD
jgi:hypothetical protein